MQQEKKLNYPSNAFGRFWMKIPLVVRSLLSGFGVSSLGIGIWGLSLALLPIPWSVMVMGATLVLYWLYFSGKWGTIEHPGLSWFLLPKNQIGKIGLDVGSNSGLFYCSYYGTQVLC